MNDAIEIAFEIKDKIAELPEAKEYLRLKQIIDNDSEINSLQKEIISLQKEGKIKEAEEKLSRLNSMPIIENYKIVKEQLAETLRTISNIIK